MQRRLRITLVLFLLITSSFAEAHQDFTFHATIWNAHVETEYLPDKAYMLAFFLHKLTVEMKREETHIVIKYQPRYKPIQKRINKIDNTIIDYGSPCPHSHIKNRRYKSIIIYHYGKFDIKKYLNIAYHALSNEATIRKNKQWITMNENEDRQKNFWATIISDSIAYEENETIKNTLKHKAYASWFWDQLPKGIDYYYSNGVYGLIATQPPYTKQTNKNPFPKVNGTELYQLDDIDVIRTFPSGLLVHTSTHTFYYCDLKTLIVSGPYHEPSYERFIKPNVRLGYF